MYFYNKTWPVKWHSRLLCGVCCASIFIIDLWFKTVIGIMTSSHLHRHHHLLSIIPLTLLWILCSCQRGKWFYDSLVFFFSFFHSFSLIHIIYLSISWSFVCENCPHRPRLMTWSVFVHLDYRFMTYLVDVGYILCHEKKGGKDYKVDRQEIKNQKQHNFHFFYTGFVVVCCCQDRFCWWLGLWVKRVDEIREQGESRWEADTF